MALSSKNSEKSDAESMNFCLTGRCGASGGGTHGGHVSKTQSIRKAGFDIARGCTIRAVVTKARPNRSSNHRPKKRQLLRRYSRGAAHLCKRGLLCRSNCSIAVDRATELALQLASLMERPSIRVAVGDARRAAAETGETIDDFGSVRGLDWVRRPSTPDQHGTRAKPVQRRRKPARAGADAKRSERRPRTPSAGLPRGQSQLRRDVEADQWHGRGPRSGSCVFTCGIELWHHRQGPGRRLYEGDEERSGICRDL
jgi:hypothetical protein